MPLTVEVDPGTHTIRIERDGYFTIQFDVTVEAGKTYNISRTLIPENAFTIVSITSTPTEPAEGEEVTLTVTVRNNTGQARDCKVSITQPDFDFSQEVTIPNVLPGTTVRGTAKFAAPASGKYDFKVKAMVYVEEHVDGAGWYVTDEKTFTLEVSPKKATIVITTTPPGARIFVDGNFVGMS